MVEGIEIEFEADNETLVQVLVDNPVTEVQVIVEDPLPVEVIEIHVDLSAAQTALDAAAAAQAILDEIIALGAPLPVYIHDFISTPGQQTFIIPDGYKVNSVFNNRSFLVLTEYTIVDNVITIIEALEPGTIISTR